MFYCNFSDHGELSGWLNLESTSAFQEICEWTGESLDESNLQLENTACEEGLKGFGMFNLVREGREQTWQ